MSEINVVPYIDVMLVLLVIFMVTAPLLQQGVEIELPEASADPMPESRAHTEPLIVSVDQSGAFFLNRGKSIRPLPNDQLVAEVQSLLNGEPEADVYVRGDHRVDYGRVMQAMVILQDAGVEKIGLMTEPPPSDTVP
jgi:biopolymer transport protein TolR